MKNKKTILTGSMIAGALIGLSSVTSDAAALTSYAALNTEAVSAIPSFELNCGEGKKEEGKAEGKKEGKKKEKGEKKKEEKTPK